MKNIHILSTENSSRLSINDGILILHRLQWRKGTQHIYITNDEIVTEYLTGLYFIDIDTGKNNIFSPIYINKETIAAGKFHTYMNNGNMCKKIIMTTDPQLIANGVQAIDDEFLEWFVKNPSCEFVKTYYVPKNIFKDKDGWEYEIIIPKEEPKQVCVQCDGNRETVFSGTYSSQKKCDVCNGRGYVSSETIKQAEEDLNLIKSLQEPKQETLEELAERLKGKELFKEGNDRARETLSEIKLLPKQETLEEVALKLFPDKSFWIGSGDTSRLYDPNLNDRERWIQGAKWQQEQDKKMYSEVFEWLANKDYLSDKVELIQKEFKQFKKK
jgi:hypothetical protein